MGYGVVVNDVGSAQVGETQFEVIVGGVRDRPGQCFFEYLLRALPVDGLAARSGAIAWADENQPKKDILKTVSLYCFCSARADKICCIPYKAWRNKD